MQSWRRRNSLNGGALTCVYYPKPAVAERMSGCCALQATLGGMVSQELIKVLTTQFVPVDTGYLVNMLDNTASRIPV